MTENSLTMGLTYKTHGSKRSSWSKSCISVLLFLTLMDIPETKAEKLQKMSPGTVATRHWHSASPTLASPASCKRTRACRSVSNRHRHTILNVAIFAPHDLSFMFTMQRVKPAVLAAEQSVHRKQLLPGHRFNWLPGDSKCNSRDAAIHAFNTVSRYKMALFLGPVCDYSLAPVARYSPYWDVPVVSPGGFAHKLGTEKLSGKEGAEYPLLTRTGYTFNSMALTILDVLNYFRWGKVKIIYRSEGHSEIVPSFCHLAGGAMGYYLENESKREFDPHRILSDKHDYEELLLEQLGTRYAGKSHLSSSGHHDDITQ